MAHGTLRPRWKMPKWMKPLEQYITNTGGNDVEEIYNDRRNHLHTNMPRAVICYCVQSQVDLLLRLRYSTTLLGED